jgi:hypothetical protein
MSTGKTIKMAFEGRDLLLQRTVFCEQQQLAFYCGYCLDKLSFKSVKELQVILFCNRYKKIKCVKSF